MNQCLILEDEPEFSDQLSGYIERTTLFAPPIVCTSAMGAFQALANTPVDLVFIDIQLPDISGIDLLKALSKRPPVIVTSAHGEQAIDCYDLDVVDFLHKPYDYNRFLRAVSRALLRKTPELVPEVTKDLPIGRERDIVFFKSGRRIERFRFDDILFIEAYGLYSKVHTIGGTVAISKRISAVLDALIQDRFIRIHKSYIINVTYLRRLELKQVWINDHKLPIGITYRPFVHEKMAQLGVKEKQSA